MLLRNALRVHLSDGPGGLAGDGDIYIGCRAKTGLHSRRRDGGSALVAGSSKAVARQHGQWMWELRSVHECECREAAEGVIFLAKPAGSTTTRAVLPTKAPGRKTCRRRHVCSPCFSSHLGLRPRMALGWRPGARAPATRRHALEASRSFLLFLGVALLCIFSPLLRCEGSFKEGQKEGFGPGLRSLCFFEMCRVESRWRLFEASTSGPTAPSMKAESFLPLYLWGLWVFSWVCVCVCVCACVAARLRVGSTCLLPTMR